MSIGYKFDESTGVWNILAFGSELTVSDFMDRLFKFFIENQIVDCCEHAPAVLGANCFEIYKVTSYTSRTKDDKGEETLHPQMLASWVTINLDYAQSHAYGRTYRAAYKRFQETPREDYSTDDAADREAKDLLMRFSMLLVGHDTLFGDLTERKKKKKKK